jgi:hypothetical protein
LLCEFFFEGKKIKGNREGKKKRRKKKKNNTGVVREKKKKKKKKKRGKEIETTPILPESLK